MIDWIPVLASLAAAVGSVVALIIAWRKAPAETRKVEADAGNTITDAAVALVEPLKQRISDLEEVQVRNKARITALEVEVDALKCQIRDADAEKAELLHGTMRLIHQLESMGLAPVWKPRDKSAP
jgi:hypothetical protein